MAITEHSLSVDDFENPKVYKDAKAVSVLLTRLLLLEPGTYQSHPEMGVGLVSKYRFGVEGTVERELQTNFKRQIEEYLPKLQGVTVEVKIQESVIIISVEVDNTLYGIYYDTNTSTVNTQYTSLSNL